MPSSLASPFHSYFPSLTPLHYLLLSALLLPTTSAELLLVETTSMEEGVVGRDELQLESADNSSNGDCYANRLELNIQRRMHRILRRAYAKISKSQHKKRMKNVFKINRKKIANMKLRRTCTDQPEEMLRNMLSQLKNPITRKHFVLLISDLIKSEDRRGFLKTVITFLKPLRNESDGRDYSDPIVSSVSDEMLFYLLSAFRNTVRWPRLLGRNHRR